MDRGGEVPPTSPLRSRIPSQLHSSQWRFAVSTSTASTPRTGSRSRPACARHWPTEWFSPPASTPASRSTRRRVMRLERALSRRTQPAQPQGADDEPALQRRPTTSRSTPRGGSGSPSHACPPRPQTTASRLTPMCRKGSACLLWVISGRMQCKERRCPLYPRRRTLMGFAVRLRNVLVFDRNYVAFPALLNSCHSALWLVCRLLPCVWRDILVAHADP